MLLSLLAANKINIIAKSGHGSQKMDIAVAFVITFPHHAFVS